MKLIWESPLGRRVYRGEWTDLLERCKWALRINRADSFLEDVAGLIL